MSSRNKRRHELDSLINDKSGDSEGGRVGEVRFESSEVPLILQKPFYSHNYENCNYDKLMIGSDIYWHQVVVSFINEFKLYIVNLLFSIDPPWNAYFIHLDFCGNFQSCR